MLLGTSPSGAGSSSGPILMDFQRGWHQFWPSSREEREWRGFSSFFPYFSSASGSGPSVSGATPSAAGLAGLADARGELSATTSGGSGISFSGVARSERASHCEEQYLSMRKFVAYSPTMLPWAFCGVTICE